MAGAAVMAVAFGMARYVYGLTLPAIRAELEVSELVLGVIASVTFVGFLLSRGLRGLVQRPEPDPGPAQLGLDAARARGTRLGRPRAMTPEQVRHTRDLLTRRENTVTAIARLLGVSRSMLYRHLPELSAGRGARAVTAEQR